MTKYRTSAVKRRIRSLTSTQKQELAKTLGVSVRTIDHWITGRNLPSKKHLPALAEALGCNVGELILDVFYPEGMSTLKEVETSQEPSSYDTSKILALPAKNFTSLIKSFMARQKISYDELGQKLGKSRMAVSKNLTGNPKIGTRKALVVALGEKEILAYYQQVYRGDLSNRSELFSQEVIKYFPEIPSHVRLINLAAQRGDWGGSTTV